MTAEPTTSGDGPVDVKIDVSALSKDDQDRRRKQYEYWVNLCEETMTADGHNLNFGFYDRASEWSEEEGEGTHWIKSGHVSIARKACQLCSEINSCRPQGTPPLACIVKAGGPREAPNSTLPCALCWIRDKKTEPCQTAKNHRIPSTEFIDLDAWIAKTPSHPPPSLLAPERNSQEDLKPDPLVIDEVMIDEDGSSTSTLSDVPESDLSDEEVEDEDEEEVQGEVELVSNSSLRLSKKVRSIVKNRVRNVKTFETWIDPKGHIKTASGRILQFDFVKHSSETYKQYKMLRKKNQLEVVKEGCNECVELNKVRPPGHVPLECLARTELKRVESGAKVCCVLCNIRGNGFTQCCRVDQEFPQESVNVASECEKGKDVERVEKESQAEEPSTSNKRQRPDDGTTIEVEEDTQMTMDSLEKDREDDDSDIAEPNQSLLFHKVMDMQSKFQDEGQRLRQRVQGQTEIIKGQGLLIETFLTDLASVKEELVTLKSSSTLSSSARQTQVDSQSSASNETVLFAVQEMMGATGFLIAGLSKANAQIEGFKDRLLELKMEWEEMDSKLGSQQDELTAVRKRNKDLEETVDLINSTFEERVKRIISGQAYNKRICSEVDRSETSLQYLKQQSKESRARYKAMRKLQRRDAKQSYNREGERGSSSTGIQQPKLSVDSHSLA